MSCPNGFGYYGEAQTRLKNVDQGSGPDLTTGLRIRFQDGVSRQVADSELAARGSGYVRLRSISGGEIQGSAPPEHYGSRCGGTMMARRQPAFEIDPALPGRSQIKWRC